MTTTSPSDFSLSATPADLHAYISDMLSQLADLARQAGDLRLEGSMRLLAVEAAAGDVGSGDPGSA